MHILNTTINLLGFGVSINVETHQIKCIPFLHLMIGRTRTKVYDPSKIASDYKHTTALFISSFLLELSFHYKWLNK